MKHHQHEHIPDLSSKVCTSLVAEQSWFRGKLQHSCNAFYLQVDGQEWHRFSVHCVGIYWKPVASPVHPVTDASEGWEYRLTPLKHYDVTGWRIECIDAFEDKTDQILIDDMRVCREAELRIHFAGGARLEFHYMGDDLKVKLIEC